MPIKLRLLFSTALVLAGAACATAPEPAKLVEMRAAKLTDQPSAKPDEALYQAAAAAIERRDYAMALDALQAARARSPDDPRVWNAMGVVYDKLGRFDLSARYYAQAQTFDPSSKVVAQNLAYSDVLQHKQDAPRALAQAPAAVTADPQVAAIAAPAQTPVAAPEVRVSAAPAPARVASAGTPPAAAPMARLSAREPEPRSPRLATVAAPPARPAGLAALSEQLARWTAPAAKAASDVSSVAKPTPPAARRVEAPAGPAPLPVRAQSPIRMAQVVAAPKTLVRVPARSAEMTAAPATPGVAAAAGPAPLPMKAQQPVRMAQVAAAPKTLARVPASPIETTIAPAAPRAAAAAGPAPLPMKAQPPIRMARVTSAPKSLLRIPMRVAETTAALAAPVARAPAPVRSVAAVAPAQPVLRAQADATRRSPAAVRPATPASNRITLAVAPRLGAPLVRRPTSTSTITLARNSLPAASMLGRPLMVVNASGRRGGAEPVRLKLASRGWSAPIAVVRPGGVRNMSTIRYAQRNVVVARALARTLPYKVRLESCASSCVGVTLFVGVDALRWASTRGATATPRRRA